MPNMSPNKTKMNMVDANIRKTNFNQVFSGYTKEQAIEEATRCLNCPLPKCKEGCPIHNNIPEFLKATREEDFKKAYDLILEKSILPDICGTVCPHEDQCEGHCVRGIRGESVGIGSVERFIVEYAIENGYTKDEMVSKNGKKVACVGAGPASISFGLYLAKKGYQVDIYEKEQFLGGILKWGIPSYRLDESVTKRYFDRLETLGAKFILGYKVGKDHPLEDLINKYDGVFIGNGAINPNPIKTEGDDLEGIYKVDDFLGDINIRSKDINGRKAFRDKVKNVLIVGGGNAAMDAARNAIRLGGVESVTIVYRRSEEEMPACKEELLHAKEEGIEFVTLTNPYKFIGKDGHVCECECAIMELGEPDASGRRRPVESSKPHKFIKCDCVVAAIGFSNDSEIALTTPNLEADKWGCFIVDEHNQTSIPNVYAGGDGVRGTTTVINAMKDGLNAARSFDNKIKGE